MAATGSRQVLYLFFFSFMRSGGVPPTPRSQAEPRFRDGGKKTHFLLHAFNASYLRTRPLVRGSWSGMDVGANPTLR